jgi:hypothetical protein
MKYDLNLYSLTYQGGQLQNETPGFFAWAAPKRAVRGRQDDSLIMLVTIKGGKSFSEQSRKDLFEKVSNDFFKSSGSVTTAMRMVIDTVNLTLLERNLKLVEDSDRISTDILMGVFHYDTLFVAQCGLTHGYLINQNGLTHFFDPEVGERGLGLSRMPKVRYFQDSVQDGSFLIVSPAPPQSWQPELLIRNDKPNLEQLWRRLHHQMPQDQVAGLIKIDAGTGSINLVTSKVEETAVAAKPDTQPSNQSRVQESEPVVLEDIPQERLADIPEEEQTPVTEALEDEVVKEIQIDESEPGEAVIYCQTTKDEEIFPPVDSPDQSIPNAKNGEAASEVAEELAAEGENLAAGRPAEDMEISLADANAQPQKDGGVNVDEMKQKSLKFLAKLLNWLHKAGDKIGAFFKGHGEKTLGQQSRRLSKGTMVMIAIIVPVLVVAVAMSVYIARGKDRQYQLYLELGQAAANNAPLFSDPVDQRNAWNDAQELANLAVSYRNSDAANALLKQTRIALDGLDGAVRLVYQPAFAAETYSSLNISRIIPFATDLYVLDAYAGQVVHLTMGTHGYQMNTNFVCAAGTYNNITVGSLVDMVSIPLTNKYKAPILALDAQGNLLYCANGKEPVAFSLTAPDAGWGLVKAAAYNSNSGTLYLLDTEMNEIWIYQGFSSEFTNAAIPYFEEFPHNLKTAIDFDTNGDELYVLHADGHMSRCISSGIQGIDLKCTDPETYKDARVGVEGFDLATLKFTQVSYSGPLDPSLYLLSPADMAIYQFSVLMNLNRIYRSDYDQQNLAGRQPTAFAISSNRSAYLAFGNQLYYAVMP